MDALIDAADVNRDWRLDFEEFTTMLSPGYRPPQKREFISTKMGKKSVWKKYWNTDQDNNMA